MEEYSEESAEMVLRSHIRSLLLDYALEHLAVDHVAYSNAFVPPFLFENLEAVSMVDSACISLPENPINRFLQLQQVTKSNGFGGLSERWEMTANNQDYLRKTIASSRRKSDTSRSYRELSVTEVDSYRSTRPLSPPLRTRRSLKAAPKLSCGAARMRLSSYPASLSALLQHQIAAIEVSDMRDENSISMERILNVRAHMTAEEQAAFKMLISTLPKSHPHHPAFHFNSPVSSSFATYLSCESPPPTPTTLRPMSPPLFPRHYAAIHNPQALEKKSRSGTSLLNLVRAAAPLVSPNLEGDDVIDWPRENMAIIDGWAAYLPNDTPFANLPSLSPGGSSSSQNQVDELMWEASPEPDSQHDQLDTVIASARLDDFEIPRSRRFGTGIRFEQEMPNIPAEMAKILQTIPMTPPLVAAQPRNSIALDVSISPSMVGQPPSPLSASACDDPDAGLLFKKEGIDLNNLDEVLMALYRPGEGRRLEPESWILDARIDEKDAFLLDVPILPEPNICPPSPSAFRLPFGFQSLLASSLQSSVKTTLVHRGSHSLRVHAADFLGKNTERTIMAQNPIQLGRVAGLASLNIELSWRYVKLLNSTLHSSAHSAKKLLIHTASESWIIELCKRGSPIVSGLTVPTHEDCARVSNFFSLKTDEHDASSSSPQNDYDHEARVYLAKLQALMDGNFIDHFSCWSEDLSLVGASATYTFGGYDGLILTRSERQVHGTSGAPFQDNPARPVSEHENTIGILLGEDLSINDAALHDTFDEEASAILRDPFLPSLGFPLGMDRDSIAPVETSSSCTPLKKKRRVEDATIIDNTEALISLVKSSGLLTCSSQNSLGHQTSDPPLPLPAFAPSYVHASSLVERYLPLESRSLLAQAEVLSPEATDSVERSIARFRHIKGGGPKLLQSASFDALRNDSDQHDQIGSAVAPREVIPGSERRLVPQDLLDIYALRLSYPWIPPLRSHKYIASLSLIQKRAVASALSDPHLGAVHLIERNISSTYPPHGDENEDGPDIVIDSHTAVVLVPLARLPSIGLALFKRIQELSWRFDRLMIIFEAYPIAQSYVSSFRVRTGPRNNNQECNIAPDAFGPPVRAALKRLRREITIAREIGGLCSTSIVHRVFAMDPIEAAQYVRSFGDIAEKGCSAHIRGEVWDERLWMSEDETVDETDFASFPRMNIFAAITILSRISPDDFLNLGTAGRTQRFADLIGAERMDFVNEELAKRLQHLGQFSPAEPTLDSVTNTDPATPAKTFHCAAEPDGDDNMSFEWSRHPEHLLPPQFQMMYAQDDYGEEIFLSDLDGDVTMYDL